MTEPPESAARDAVGDELPEWHELEVALRAFFARRVPAADVGDLLQECHLRVGRGLDALESHESLGAWVFRIARNLVVDHLRRRRQEAHEPLPEDLADARAGAGDDLDLRVGGWLAGWIDRLPPRYAEVLRLSELQGVPYQAIAGRLGLSVSGVKARVRRGRAMLRDRLLACCRLEFDRRGGISGYDRQTPGSCDC